MFLIWIKCTIFTPAIYIINIFYSDTTAFLKNYQHQRSVKTAFSNLELDHLQRHLQVELQRQNRIASTSKQQCEVQMRRAIQEFTEVWTPPRYNPYISILLCFHFTFKYEVYNSLYLFHWVLKIMPLLQTKRCMISGFRELNLILLLYNNHCYDGYSFWHDLHSQIVSTGIICPCRLTYCWRKR